MSNFLKQWRARQRGLKPGETVPGTGRKDNAQRRRSALKMRPYERPRKGGGKQGVDND